MDKVIKNQTFDEERALYHLEDTEVSDCVFAGPADGESALKEARGVRLSGCSFSLRYPLWHARNFTVENSRMDTGTRAPVWYSVNGQFSDCEIEGIKCLRECKGIVMERCRVISPEFGWRCQDVRLKECDMESEYFLFESRNVEIEGLTMKGKYSFQYVENMRLSHSDLDTKDAFWHSKNVTVENCIVKGEYLGWYSEGLTLRNCRIIGTQPLCYCRGLRLENCVMVDTDLAFEYSEVEADVRGGIVSVKNPRSGRIEADSIGEIILENSVMKSEAEIKLRSQAQTL